MSSFYESLPSLYPQVKEESDQSYLLGYQEGCKTREGEEQKKIELASKIRDLCISQQRSYESSMKEIRKELLIKSSSVICKVLTQFFPSLKRKFGLEGVMDFLLKHSPEIKTDVVLEVHEDMVQEVRLLLCQEESLSYSINKCNPNVMNVVEVKGTLNLEFGEARISFEGCGVERILSDYRERLEELVGRELAST